MPDVAFLHISTTSARPRRTARPHVWCPAGTRPPSGGRALGLSGGPASPAGSAQVHGGHVEPPGLQDLSRSGPSPGSGVRAGGGPAVVRGLKDWVGVDFTSEGPMLMVAVVSHGRLGGARFCRWQGGCGCRGVEPVEPFYSPWAVPSCGGPRGARCGPSPRGDRRCEVRGGLTPRSSGGQGCGLSILTAGPPHPRELARPGPAVHRARGELASPHLSTCFQRVS